MNETLINEHKILLRNTIYSFLINYGNLIFQIVLSILIARIISQIDWGLYILAISTITIISIISNYFPPALDHSINYFIPRYIALNQESEMKNFLIKAIILKLLFIFCLFLISILIFNIFGAYFTTFLRGKMDLLYFLSPLILILGFYPLLNAITRSFNMFKTMFYLVVLQYFIQIILLVLFCLILNNNDVNNIAFISSISYMIPVIINFVIIFNRIRKIDSKDKKGLKYGEILRRTFKYGFPISFGYLVYGFWKEIQIQGAGIFNPPEIVTGYNISLAYSNYSDLFLVSFYFPLFTSFSSLEVYNKAQEISKIYRITIKYSLFILLMITGILFFFSDFFLLVIYGPSYRIYSTFLKLIILAKIFNILISPFDSLILAKNKSPYIAYIRIIMIIIYTTLFFWFMIQFNIIGSIISLSVSNILIFLLYFSLTIKVLKIKIKVKDILFQYITFFISLFLVLTLNTYFLNTFNSVIFELLGLNFLINFPIFSIFCFLIVYISLNLFLRVFSRQEIEYLCESLNKENRLNQIIIFFLKKFEKLVF